MQEYINFFKSDSIFTITRDFSVFFLFHNYLVMKNNLKPYPTNYKNTIIKQLRNMQKTRQPIIENRRIPRPDEIEMIYEELNKRIEKLSMLKSDNANKRLNKTICTLFAVKMACSFGFFPKDFENLRIEINYLVIGDKEWLNLTLHPEIKKLAEVWISEMGHFDSAWLEKVHTQINDRVRKLPNAWTLGELAQTKRAYPKNCVNDHKMVEIPKEIRWSWHERKRRKKRILSTNCLIISTSEG